MFGRKKENDYEENEPDVVQTESSTEEYEFYDMSEFEQKLFRKMAVMEDKMDTILSEVEDNNHRLKNIQFQFTRALIIRLIRLTVIISVLYLVYINFLEPVLDRATRAYSSLEVLQMQMDANPDQSMLERVQGFFPGEGE